MSVRYLTDDDLQRLGHELFFDSDLSFSGKIACSTCHNPSLAFTDGYRKSVNAYGDQLDKNTPTLLNLSDNMYFNWSHSKTSLFDQLDGPLGNDHPEELGFYNGQEQIVKRLESKRVYQKILSESGGAHLYVELIKCALVSYVESLEYRNSQYDKSLRGTEKLSSRQLQGKRLFFSNRYNCAECHGGLDFDQGTNSILNENSALMEYKIPTLRNLVVTDPYWHDGRTTSLTEAINLHFVEQKISEKDIGLLVTFLESLTDTAYLNLPYFNAPNETR